MRMFNESQMLDPKFRVAMIEEIESEKNARRKQEALKRQEVFRDNTAKWVLKSLRDMGLEKDTLRLMEEHTSNISICKKIIKKKCRSYSGGVERKTNDEELDSKIQRLASLVNLDEKMRKADQFVELQKNALLWTRPEPMPNGKFRPKVTVMAPWQYDVIEDARDCENALAYVLSDFDDREPYNVNVGSQTTAVESQVSKSVTEKPTTYIWWSENFHFTTDAKGVILPGLSPENLENPIHMLPGVTLALDQDGKYWSTGGQDLVDGSILINLLLTDMFAIQYIQGWGQLVITGEGLPTKYYVGPHVVLELEAKQGSESASAPDAKYISANPPLEKWMQSIELYAALLLSTNDLSPSTVAAKLDGGSASSGIAMMIDKSEINGSIDEKRSMLQFAERQVWKRLIAWHNTYTSARTSTNETAIDEDFDAVGAIPDNTLVNVRFSDPREVITEKERLENFKLRRELALSSPVDLLMLDGKDITREQAEQRLEQIKEDFVKFATVVSMAMGNASGATSVVPEDTESDSESTDTETEAVVTGEAATGGGNVASTALNGAQISSIVEIVVGIQSGEIPKESAPAIIRASFPFLTEETISSIVAPTSEGSSKTEPAPAAKVIDGNEDSV